MWVSLWEPKSAYKDKSCLILQSSYTANRQLKVHKAVKIPNIVKCTIFCRGITENNPLIDMEGPYFLSEFWCLHSIILYVSSKLRVISLRKKYLPRYAPVANGVPPVFLALRNWIMKNIRNKRLHWSPLHDFHILNLQKILKKRLKRNDSNLILVVTRILLLKRRRFLPLSCTILEQSLDWFFKKRELNTN